MRVETDMDRPSLLLLNLYMVYPPNSGAKVVIYNRLVELSERFRITFCCLGEQAADEAGAGELARFAEVVVARGGAPRRRDVADQLGSLLRDPCALPFADKLAAWFASAEMRDLLWRRRFDVIELHSSCWYRRCLGNVPGIKVLVAHNRERDYYAARARAAFRLGVPAAGLRAAVDVALVSVQEKLAVGASDAIVSLAPMTAAEQRSRFGDRPVLCNWGGVDLGASVANDREEEVTSRSELRLLFIAALFVESAVEAAERFVIEALPPIVEAFPNVRLSLVGDHRGHPTIARLGRTNPHVDVTGLVPDVQPYLAAADVVVVPLVGGSGVRYKIMEACAAGKAVVSTSKGAEGLGLRHGHDGLLSETVAEMAPLVVRLLADGELRRGLGRRARETAERRFDRTVEHRRLAQWYEELLRRAVPSAASRRS